MADRLSAVMVSMWMSPFSRDFRFIFASMLSIDRIFSLDKSSAYIDCRFILLKNFSDTYPISNLAPVFSSKYSVNCWII